MDFFEPINKIVVPFKRVSASLILLNALEKYDYGILLMGLIFNILLLIFIINSCLLIYSLLLISVEKKAHEIAIMRLVGLTQNGFIAMILTQAFMFVIPAILCGIVLSVVLVEILSKIFVNPSDSC